MSFCFFKFQELLHCNVSLLRVVQLMINASEQTICFKLFSNMLSLGEDFFSLFKVCDRCCYIIYIICMYMCVWERVCWDFDSESVYIENESKVILLELVGLVGTYLYEESFECSNNICHIKEMLRLVSKVERELIGDEHYPIESIPTKRKRKKTVDL